MTKDNTLRPIRLLRNLFFRFSLWTFLNLIGGIGSFSPAKFKKAESRGWAFLNHVREIQVFERSRLPKKMCTDKPASVEQLHVIHIHIYVYIYMYIHTYIHTYTYTYIPIWPIQFWYSSDNSCPIHSFWSCSDRSCKPDKIWSISDQIWSISDQIQHWSIQSDPVVLIQFWQIKFDPVLIQWFWPLQLKKAQPRRHSFLRSHVWHPCLIQVWSWSSFDPFSVIQLSWSSSDPSSLIRSWSSLWSNPDPSVLIHPVVLIQFLIHQFWSSCPDPVVLIQFSDPVVLIQFWSISSDPSSLLRLIHHPDQASSSSLDAQKNLRKLEIQPLATFLNVMRGVLAHFGKSSLNFLSSTLS